MSEEATSSPPLFSELCNLLEKLKKSSTRACQRRCLEQFFKECRRRLSPPTDSAAVPPAASSTVGGNYTALLPTLRQLLPAQDRQRGSYGLKQRRLADLYVRVLSLAKHGDAARTLYTFRSSGSTAQGRGDLADTLYYLLKDRCAPDSDKRITIQEMDERLTAMARAHQNGRQSEVDSVMMQLVHDLPALQQKWLVRILLKQMALGVGHSLILSALHINAEQHYNVTSCLAGMCAALCADDTSRSLSQVALFTAFRPMLSARSSLEHVERQMGDKPFLIEPKHDGERVQLHRNGTTYRFFSRNGFDFTASFGSGPSCGSLVPFIHAQFADSVQSCIVDGEMLVWNSRHSCVIVKGEAPDVKALRPAGGSLQPMFVPFDLLYLNGQVLTELPLRERLAKLKCAYTPLDGRLGETTQLHASTQAQVIEALNAAIDRRDEGLILKDPESVYKLAGRRHGWVKVKPEYVNALVDDLDMLIIGGYYGTGRKRGVVSRFMLGAAVTSGDDTMQHPSTFISCGSVGSGYTESELQTLLQHLMPHFRRRGSDGQPPPGLDWGSEKPDLWIQPSHSRVVQVKATEIIESSSYKSGLIPRFPRVVSVRSDKSWYEAISVNEMRRLRSVASGKLATRHLQRVTPSTSDQQQRGRVVRAHRSALLTRTVVLPRHRRPADLTRVTVTSQLLQGRRLTVLSSNADRTKQDLERMIHEMGGEVTQNPVPDTWCVIAGRRNVQVDNVIRSGRYDVVHCDWLVRCHIRKRFLAWSPADLLHSTTDTQLKLAQQYDSCGDSYTHQLTAAQLRQLLQAMPSQFGVSSVVQPAPWDEQLAEIIHDAPYGLFRGCRVFLVSPLDVTSVSALKLRVYGASLSPRLDDPEVSHVILPTMTSEGSPDPVLSLADGLKTTMSGILDEIRATNATRQRKFHLVSERWVSESVDRGKRAEERAFGCLSFEDDSIRAIENPMVCADGCVVEQ